MKTPRATFAALTLLLATLCAACLHDVHSGALFVDEPGPLSSAERLGEQDLPQGQSCASSQNCAAGLRCVRRGERQTCEETCQSDQSCAAGLICRSAINDTEQGWCGAEPVAGGADPELAEDAPPSPEEALDPDQELDPEAEPPEVEPPDAGGGCQAPLVQAQLQALNGDRVAQGLSALCCHEGLAGVALGHSRDMALRGYFDHTTPEGQQPWDRMDDAGVRGWTNAGENIAYGYETADAVQAGWMDSPGHRANILTPGFTHVGVGTFQEGGGARHWTQLFATFPELRCDP